MGRPRGRPNKNEWELKKEVEVAELKHKNSELKRKNKVLADENKKLKRK